MSNERGIFMREKRAEVGLSTSDLARFLEVSEADVSAWEDGTQSIPRSVDIFVSLIGSAVKIIKTRDGIGWVNACVGRTGR